MRLPQYTKKDLLILAGNMPFVVVVINTLLFGKRFFTEAKVFVVSGFIVLLVMTIVWFGFTWMAVTIRNRLPSNKDLISRIGITIALIATVQVLVMTLFFKGYDYFNVFGYTFNQSRYYWTLAIGFFINILVTLLHEGVDSFERWKTTLTETEQLKKAYAQSQLLGLKSQVNPHFLFNSLNSLSSLISEDEEKAEIFLNELTRVYRYLLRNNDEQLVTLEKELQFIHSYYYLLKTRYGDAVELSIAVDDVHYGRYVTPLLLQALFEYGFNINMLSKESPLKFNIHVDADNWLVVKNNLQQKQNAGLASTEGISNLVEKYKLMSGEKIDIHMHGNVFMVRIPLLNEHTTGSR